jgi:tetratricopeptide (TPR) repeat protein
MSRLIVVLAFLLFAVPARATDQPAYAPPGDWVKLQELPQSKSPDTGTPTRILLQNMQIRFTDDARETFIETINKVQTAQGLQAAGSIALAWKPDTDSLTIHTFKIVRGDQTIDLLAGGHAFTVLRRENNLEMAMLDGALTAAAQPGGLQVGDILDVAFTLRRSDPVLQGHAEMLTGNLAGVYADKTTVREIWPKSKKMRWRQTEGLVPFKMSSTKDGEEISIEMNDVQPVRGPKGAPARYFALGELEGTEFQSWADVSALMAPLYQKAAEIGQDSPLKAEAEKIKASTTDPKMRAMAALKLVEDQIRYFFLGMNNGGYVPANADETWSRRFGDCKGKTVVLLALLHELGIEAEPALASISRGDWLNERLPTLEIFDHVMVRAVIDGKVYWLDGTRVGDRTLDDLPIPAYHWLLPVQHSGATLTKIDVPIPAKPLLEIELQLDASSGLDMPATAHAVAIFRSDAAIAANLQAARASKSDLDKYLKDYWRGLYDWIDISKVDAAYDPSTGEERLSMDGSGKMDWKVYAERPERQYQVAGAFLGWKAEFDRDPGPNDNAPFAVAYPYFAKYSESVRLPENGAGFTAAGDDVDKIVAGRELTRTSKIEGGIYKVEATIKSLAREFPFADAVAAKAELRALLDDAVDIVAPKSVLFNQMDIQDIQKEIDANNFKAAGFISDGTARMDAQDFDRAIGDFDRAIELSPNAAAAFAGRGIAYFWEKKYEKAKSDLDRANEIDSNLFVVFHGYGLLAQHTFDYQGAVENFTKSINLNPNDDFAFERRGINYEYLRDYQKALADYGASIEANPNRKSAYWHRAELLIWLKKGEQAMPDAEHLIALAPAESYGHILKANALNQIGKKTEADAELAALLEERPSVEAYLARARLHIDSPDDAIADVNRALELDAKSADGFALRADLYSRKNDSDHAIADANQAVALSPDDQRIRKTRINLLIKDHKDDLALKDHDYLVSQAPDNPSLLNNRCWFRAQLGKDLDAALADCDASLKIRELPATLDSRGFVYLRLAQPDKAIADYDAALKERPNQASSLFGRGIAKLRKGMADDGEADLAAARAIDPKIDAQFADYGVKP